MVTGAKRLLAKLHHYAVWQFAAIAIAMRIIAPRVAMVIIMRLGLSYVTPQASIVVGSIYTGFALLLIFSILIYERSTIYADLTHGRNYRKDQKYQRSWSSLIDYYRDADPYSIDPTTLPRESWTQAEGVILGKVGDRLVKRDSFGVGNLATFGLPGSGKTQSQIIPTAARFAGSCLVIDIKGDILSKTKSVREKVKVFAPGDPAHSCHFDPLSGIQTMTASDKDKYIRRMAAIIIAEEPKDPYFYRGARSFFSGIFLHSLDEHPDATFPVIIESIINGNAIDWVTTIRNGSCTLAQAYTNSFWGTNEKNVAGCYQHLADAVRVYGLGDLASLIDGKGDCISADALDDGYDVYLEIPQDSIGTLAPITTLIIENFTTACMRRPDNSTGASLVPILFVLDEFPQLNFDLQTLLSGMQTLRSKNVSYFLAMQSVSSLSNRYGDDGYRQIIDACAYISIMSAQDPKSRRYFSELVGTKKILKISNSTNGTSKSISVQETREPILPPESFGDLQGKVAIVVNGRFILADKTWYSDK